MRRTLAITAVLALAAAAPSPLPAARAADAAPSIEQFLKIRTPSVPDLLPDGTLLARDWPDGVWQLYRVRPKAPASPSYRPGDVTTEALTRFPDGLSAFSTSPDGKRVVLMHARGGNENTQISLLDPVAPAGTPLETVFADPRVQATANLWFRDGSAIVYSANDESPTDFHLYRHDFATGKRTRVLGEKGTWFANDVTEDGSRMLVTRYLSASNTEVYELDLASGRRTDLTIRPKDGTAACQVVGYMPGEKAVLIISDWKDGSARLFSRDLKSGSVREPLPALATHELDAAGMNDRRSMLYAVTNEDGYGVPHLYTLPGLKPLPPPTAESGVLGVRSFKGDVLVWSISNARRSGEAFATTLSVTAKRPEDHRTRQLTWTEDQGIDFGAFRLPELVRYTAADGREIPAFLYLPAGAAKGRPIPFVINYHGGPESQHRPGFNATNQYLVSRGFGLLLPNVRGSTGYGREFQMLDDYTRRWDSVRDGVDAAEWLVRNGYAEPGRIATYGGSYGGFMAVACLVEDQERVERGERPQRLFGACVNVVGIVNLRTFLERTSGYRRALREVEYGPLTDTAFLESVSSLNKVDKIQVPMFIAHGFNDPRVPVEEAMQIAAALKQRNRDPRVFIAPDEGHGFQKLDNRIYFYGRAAAFLEETIGANTARP
jgi:dipeptidyl aminopeptidase/acylaminoacyl peptidase